MNTTEALAEGGAPKGRNVTTEELVEQFENGRS